MSFGFGVGDFIAVGTLAWKLYVNGYKAAQGAPAEYQALLEDLRTSSTLMRMLDDEIKDPASVLGSAGPDRTRLVVDTVYQVKLVLEAIKEIAEKHEMLAGQSGPKPSSSWKPRLIWKRIKWSAELRDVDSLRNKLGQHNTALNLLLTCAGHSSLERLEITTKGMMKDVAEIKGYMHSLTSKSQSPSFSLPSIVNGGGDMFLDAIAATLMKNAERLQPWNTVGADVWIQNGRWWLLKAQAVGLETNVTRGASVPIQAYADLLKASWILTDIMSSHPQRPFLQSNSNYELGLLNTEVKRMFKLVLGSTVNPPPLNTIEDEHLELWESSTEIPKLQAKRVTHTHRAYEWAIEGEEVFFRNFATYTRDSESSVCMVLILLNTRGSKLRLLGLEQNQNQVFNIPLTERDRRIGVLQATQNQSTVQLYAPDKVFLEFQRIEDAADFSATCYAARALPTGGDRDEEGYWYSRLEPRAYADEFKFLVLTSSVIHGCPSMTERWMGDPVFQLENTTLRRERVNDILSFARAYLAEPTHVECLVKKMIRLWSRSRDYGEKLLIFAPSIFHRFVCRGEETLIQRLEGCQEYGWYSERMKTMRMAATRGHADVIGVMLDSSHALEYLWDYLAIPVVALIHGHHAIVGLFLSHLGEEYVETGETGSIDYLEGLQRCFQKKKLDDWQSRVECETFLDESDFRAVVENERMDILQMILSLGAPVAVHHLFDAILHGDEATVHLLLDNGVDINWTGRLCRHHPWWSHTAVHAACYGGQMRLLKLLLAKGLSVNADNGVGELPIHLAAKSGHPGIVEAVISSGGNVAAVTDSGETPLHFVYRSNGHVPDIDQDKTKVTQLLIDAGADVNQADYRGETALHLAVEEMETGSVKALLRAGADVNAKTEYNETILSRLINSTIFGTSPGLGHELVSALFEAGVNLNVRGRTVLEQFRFSIYTDLDGRNHLSK